MALFTLSQLSARARPSTIAKTARTVLREDAQRFSAVGGYDVFLSHSSLDADVILGLKVTIEGHGLRVYVDWIEDPQLDRSKVTPTTANALRERMKACRALFYAHSLNAANSKWMPWELGYFDGLGRRVGIVPVADIRRDGFNGQEYLGLYPYVDEAPSTGGQQTLWVNSAGTKALNAKTWIGES